MWRNCGMTISFLAPLDMTVLDDKLLLQAMLPNWAWRGPWIHCWRSEKTPKKSNPRWSRIKNEGMLISADVLIPASWTYACKACSHLSLIEFVWGPIWSSASMREIVIFFVGLLQLNMLGGLHPDWFNGVFDIPQIHNEDLKSSWRCELKSPRESSEITSYRLTSAYQVLCHALWKRSDFCEQGPRALRNGWLEEMEEGFFHVPNDFYLKV